MTLQEVREAGLTIIRRRFDPLDSAADWAAEVIRAQGETLIWIRDRGRVRLTQPILERMQRVADDLRSATEYRNPGMTLQREADKIIAEFAATRPPDPNAPPPPTVEEEQAKGRALVQRLFGPWDAEAERVVSVWNADLAVFGWLHDIGIGFDADIDKRLKEAAEPLKDGTDPRDPGPVLRQVAEDALVEFGWATR